MVAHNGIIENYLALKRKLIEEGHKFTTETDTEVIAHLIHMKLKHTGDLFAATRAAVAELKGAYAIAVIAENEPQRVVVSRMGAPLLLGIGDGENFAASDASALLQVTHKIIYLEEGDVVDIKLSGFEIRDAAGTPVERKVHLSS